MLDPAQLVVRGDEATKSAARAARAAGPTPRVKPARLSQLPARDKAFATGFSPQRHLIDSKKKGKPKIDWAGIVEKEVASFSASHVTDALWWGGECKTKIKDVEKKLDQLANRVRNSHDVDEVSELRKFIKMFGIMGILASTAHQHGVESAEFKTSYDFQLKPMRLEPKVELEMPSFLSLRRLTQDIGETSDASQWLTKVSSPSLRAQGLAGESLANEQVRLWSEKLADILRKSEPKHAQDEMMRQYFRPCMDFELSDVVAGFSVALAVVVRCYDFEDLDERIDMLQDALGELDRHVPVASKKCGHILGIHPNHVQCRSEILGGLEDLCHTSSRFTQGALCVRGHS